MGEGADNDPLISNKDDNGMRLLRYNFRIVMFSNWWLLVFPIAASQLTVFWNVITQRFTPSLPATSVEMVSPLLAAFLSAHLLSSEYRVGIGAILASKPVHIGKVVMLRLAVTLGLVWALAGLSLAAYYYWMEPYDVASAAVACVVSSLFLALLALTFATRLRSPFAGFGVAALYWAMDLPSVAAINPYLSLRSLSTAIVAEETMTVSSFPGPWWIPKLVLLAGSVLLFVLHSRLVFTLGAPMTARVRRRTLAWAGALVAFYLVSGAAGKVAYGYAHRGRLNPDDASWFRKQFAAYGPLPVASLFGPAFARYLGEIPNAWRIGQEEADRWGDTLQHRRWLREVVEKMPGSLWAPSAAELLARLEARRNTTPEAAASYYRRITDRYPRSPYVTFAHQQIARIYADAGQDASARAAYEHILSEHPGSPYAVEAFRYLAGSDRKRGDLAGAAEKARRWADAAPVQERFNALAFRMETLHAQGMAPEAKEAARQTLEAVQAFRRAAQQGAFAATRGAATKWEQEAAAAQQKAQAVLNAGASPAQ